MLEQPQDRKVLLELLMLTGVNKRARTTVTTAVCSDHPTPISAFFMG